MTNEYVEGVGLPLCGRSIMRGDAPGSPQLERGRDLGRRAEPGSAYMRRGPGRARRSLATGAGDTTVWDGRQFRAADTHAEMGERHRRAS
jgi:hypothetical protein